MSEKTPSRLLVIEQDTSLAETLREHFVEAGYQVEVIANGREGIEKARTMQPNLILLATRLGDISGLDTFHVLRTKPRTGHIPVMVMASKDQAELQYEVLDAGAYDFIEKPIDLDILALSVRNVLRRAEREGLTEPRTGLPTGRLLTERLNALPKQLGWYKIELTIANFSEFRELYGFVTANEALSFAGKLITQLVNEHGTSNDFVGHMMGTETFVLITTLARGDNLQRILAARVTDELHSFYNFMEREQGYVLVEDGAGGQAQKPLMSAQVTTDQGEPDPNAVDEPTDESADDDPWEDATGESKSDDAKADDAKPDDAKADDDKPDDSGGDSAFSW